MTAATRASVAHTLITALVTAALQWALFALTLRDDVRELQREVATLNCRVAVYTRDITLPDGCHVARAVASQDGG